MELSSRQIDMYIPISQAQHEWPNITPSVSAHRGLAASRASDRAAARRILCTCDGCVQQETVITSIVNALLVLESMGQPANGSPFLMFCAAGMGIKISGLSKLFLLDDVPSVLLAEYDQS